jgi:hypothetical protein
MRCRIAAKQVLPAKSRLQQWCALENALIPVGVTTPIKVTERGRKLAVKIRLAWLRQSWKVVSYLDWYMIMCIVGVTTGAVDIVPDWGEEANLTQTSARISCDRSKVLSEFLLAYFRSSISRTFVTRHLKGSRQVRLNIGDFDNFMVPLPSLDEQRRIVVVLKSFEDAKASAATSLASQKKLASSLSKTLLRGDTGVH